MAEMQSEVVPRGGGTFVRFVVVPVREGESTEDALRAVLVDGDECDDFPCGVCAYRGVARCEDRR